MSLIWPVLVLTPLVMAALALAWAERLRRWLWVACVPALVGAAWAPPAFSPQFLWPEAQWGQHGLVAQAALGFTAALWACAGLFAAAALRGDSHQRRFSVSWLTAMSGNLLLIIAGDGLSFYVGFSMMSLAAYGLVIHRGGSQPRRAGRLYLQLAVVAEFAVFAGLVLRAHSAGGTVAFEQWRGMPLDGVTAGLLLVGFGIKMGFWPLHIWLPQAHPAAPAAASAVLSGAMLKGGLLGIWRFLPAGDALLQSWAGGVMLLGLFSAFYGALMGLATHHAKAALAYSSISQMGYFLIIVALAWQHPDKEAALAVLLALFMVHHGLSKGALFLAAGVVAKGHLGGGRWHWLWWVLMATPALSLSGLPMLSGAAAKTELKTLFAHSDFGHWLFLVKLASCGTMLLLLRAFYLLWHKQQKATQDVRAVGLLVPWILLSLAPLIMPWLWPEMRQSLMHSLTLSGSWALLWPILLALALAGLALLLNWHPPEVLARRHHPIMRASLKLKRLVQRPPIPPLKPMPSRRLWRQRERRWNRVWQNGSIKISAWLICGLLLLGWLW